MTIDDDTPAPSGSSARAPRRWIALVALALVVIGGVVLVSSSGGGGAGGDGRPGSTPGSVAPSFEVMDLRDRTRLVRLEDARGKPVVLNFFAAWCTPCRKEMPSLQAAAKRLEGKVTFIGIDHKDSRSEALDLLAETGVDYATGFDQQGEVLREYGLPDALPITLFLDEEGTVVERRLGELSETKLDEALDRLLAG